MRCFTLLFVISLQNPVCVWHTAQLNSHSHITQAASGHQTDQHQSRKSPSTSIMSDSRKACLLCAKCRGLSEGQISDKWDGNTTFTLALTRKTYYLIPLIPGFYVYSLLMPTQPVSLASSCLSGNTVTAPTVRFICSLHWSSLFTPGSIYSQSPTYTGVCPSRKFAWTLTLKKSESRRMK